MAFTLRWKNENPAGSIVKIYRGTSALNLLALPVPLVTLSNGEESWIDPTVTLNSTYYYLLTVTVGGRTVAGPQRTITIKNRRGIGAVEFLNQGDTDDLAYLGQPGFVEQFTYDAFPAGFRAMTGLSGGSQIVLNKYFHRGRVLYMFPNGGKFYNAKYTWNDIYNAGLVYGVDGFGPEGGHGTLAGVDQGGLFDWQGDTYRMRILRGLTDIDASPVMTLDPALNGVAHGTTKLGRCEYNDLVYPVSVWTPEQQRIPNWFAFEVSSMFNNAATWQGMGYLCQERDPVSGKVVMRGIGPNGTNGVRTDLERITLADPATSSGYFVPVIELME